MTGIFTVAAKGGSVTDRHIEEELIISLRDNDEDREVFAMAR